MEHDKAYNCRHVCKQNIDKDRNNTKILNASVKNLQLALPWFTFSETGKMRRATHAEVCDWVVRAWRAVTVTSITNGFRKAGITGCAEDRASGKSSDKEEMESATALDPVLDAELIDLFNSDTEDEDFNGFWTELIRTEQ